MKQLITLFLLIIISQEGIAMGLFDAGKTCVFSAVKARLTMNGEPVKNTKVTRQWDWNKLNYDEAVTDENGYVTFPARFETSLSRLLPTELVVGQQLSIDYNGEETVFWTNSKREPEENAEYGGARFDLSCELSDEEVLIEDYGSLMVTMCKMEQ